MGADSGATFFDEGPARRDAIILVGPSIGFSRHGEIFCDGARTDAHDKSPASSPMRLIAVSFHRLFLGGLLPSGARFRFAGCGHGIRSNPSRQGHASAFYACRKNSHTERSPLDSAHTSSTPASGRPTVMKRFSTVASLSYSATAVGTKVGLLVVRKSPYISWTRVPRTPPLGPRGGIPALGSRLPDFIIRERSPRRQCRCEREQRWM